MPEGTPTTPPDDATAANGPSSPAARFMDLCDQAELESRPARRVLASLVGVPDARHLSGAHFEQALAEPDKFVALVRADAGPTAKPKPETEGKDLF